MEGESFRSPGGATTRQAPGRLQACSRARGSSVAGRRQEGEGSSKGKEVPGDPDVQSPARRPGDLSSC